MQALFKTTNKMTQNTPTKEKHATVDVAPTLNDCAEHYDMVVFCHLRWQFVYQRPQHLISRMAKEAKVLFVEEPLPANGGTSANATVLIVDKNLHILQPHVKDIAAIAEILPQYIKNKSVKTGWFYSPAFCPLLDALDFDTVIYDCMDELTLFKGASPDLIFEEKYLMLNSDVVFTGGKSLYESKKKVHPNTYCFPSSVDVPHFAHPSMDIPGDIAPIKKPVIGYYGVIDERIDLELLRQTAEKMPEASFVIIGPLAKITEGDLPKRDNIHYLGMKSYDELPQYLKQFDIAMMPFALNDATKFISPTKTLEYMAAQKPIISTAITDVVRDYSHCVTIVGNPDEFYSAIEIIRSNDHSFLIPEDYIAILEQTSWDATVTQMNRIIKKYSHEKV